MSYLLDSDAAKKLCQYSLIQELADTLGITLPEFTILPQLKFQLSATKPAKALKKLGSPEAVAQLHLLLDQAAEVGIGLTGAALIPWLDRPDIDSGEQLLFAVLIEQPETQLLTGDKRALASLAKTEKPSPTLLLWPRILCFEDALLLLVTLGPFEIVSQKIRMHLEVDTATSIVFGLHTAHAKESVIEGLTSYVRSTQHETGGAYIPKALAPDPAATPCC